MKAALPWCFSLALLAGFIALHSTTKRKDSELALLRRENQQLTTLRAENEELKKIQAQVEELARLRKENAELHRLRNEVHQLREEKQQIARTGQLAQPAAAQAKIDATAQQQVQQQLQQLLAENERLRVENLQAQQTRVAAQANACINNLRQIDGAKQQWALENKKPASAPVTPQDIQPYLGNNALPICPQGGIYTLNTVGAAPTCNIPGHVLTQQ